MSENRPLLSHLKQRLSDTRNTKNWAAQNTSFKLLGYSNLLRSCSGLVSDSEGQRRMEINIVRKCLLRRFVGNDKLDMLWWLTCSDNKLLHMDSDGTVQALGSSLEDSDNWKSQQTFEDEESIPREWSGETLEMLRNSMCTCVLHELLGYHPCVENGEENWLVHGRLFGWCALIPRLRMSGPVWQR